MLFLIGNILLENRIEFLKEKFKDKVTDEEFKKLLEVDPTGNKEYLQFVISRYLGLSKIEKSRFIKEDWEIVRRDLEIYHKIKKMLPIEYKDINKIKSFAVLFMVITKYREEFERIEIDKKAEKEIIRIYEDSSYTILIPKTEEAAILYGKGTRWCTAATETRNYFNDYNEEGPLFIIIHKGEKDFQGRQVKYQFHFETGQFMDIMDRQIDLKDYIDRNDIVADKIAEWMVNNNKGHYIESVLFNYLVLLEREDLFDGDFSEIEKDIDLDILVKLYRKGKVSLDVLNANKKDSSILFEKNNVNIIYGDWTDEYLIKLFYDNRNDFQYVAKKVFRGELEIWNEGYKSLTRLNLYWENLNKETIEVIREKVKEVLSNSDIEVDVNEMSIAEIIDLVEDEDDLYDIKNAILVAVLEAEESSHLDVYWEAYTKLVKDFWKSKAEFRDNKLYFSISYEDFMGWLEKLLREYGRDEAFSDYFIGTVVRYASDNSALIHPRDDYYGSFDWGVFSERIEDRLGDM